MKKWAISALVYLLIIIAGYTAYVEFFKIEENRVEQQHDEVESHETAAGSKEETAHEGEEEGHGHEGDVKISSELKTTFVYNDGKITINLTDLNGNPVDDLEVNHEKLLHLIVVDEHLDQYNHFHPEKVGKGEFELPYHLDTGEYRAFIDMKSKNLTYEVKAVAFHVGEPHEDTHSKINLKAENKFVKTIDGETAKMELSSFKSGQPVTLFFN